MRKRKSAMEKKTSRDGGKKMRGEGEVARGDVECADEDRGHHLSLHPPLLFVFSPLKRVFAEPRAACVTQTGYLPS